MTHKTILLIAILLVVTSLSGCTTEMNTYVHENNPSESIKLYADNRYAVVTDAGFCGTWRIHNDALHLYFEDSLLHVLSPGEDGIYIDADGDKWIRK